MLDEHESDPTLQPLEQLAAGAFAGLCEHVAMFPVDLVKTLLQSPRPAQRPALRKTLSDMVRNFGVRRLYAGVSAVAIAAPSAHSLYFATYELCREGLGLPAMVCGALAVTAHDVLSTPFDVVKQRMQSGMPPSPDHPAGVPYSSLRACVRHAVATSGYGVFARSLPITIAMNVPHHATHWVVYETLRPRRSAITPPAPPVSSPPCPCPSSHPHAAEGAGDAAGGAEVDPHAFIAGGVAGACGAAATTPFDVVKTHLQLGGATRPGVGGVVAGTVTAAQAVWRRNGVRGYFHGVVPRVLYCMPAGAITMAAYEFARSFFHSRRGVVGAPPASAAAAVVPCV